MPGLPSDSFEPFLKDSLYIIINTSDYNNFCLTLLRSFVLPVNLGLLVKPDLPSDSLGVFPQRFSVHLYTKISDYKEFSLTLLCSFVLLVDLGLLVEPGLPRDSFESFLTGFLSRGLICLLGVLLVAMASFSLLDGRTGFLVGLLFLSELYKTYKVLNNGKLHIVFFFKSILCHCI